MKVPYSDFVCYKHLSEQKSDESVNNVRVLCLNDGLCIPDAYNQKSVL